MKFAHALLFTLLLPIACFAQISAVTHDTVAGKVEDVYLARDNGEGKAGDVVEGFTTGDVRIHCVVMLKGFDPTQVRMLLVAVKVPGVKPDSKVVSAAYTTKQGQDRVYFSGSADGKWIPGTYRFDIFVADRRERSVTFEIKASAAPTTAAKFAPSNPPAKRRN